MKRETLLNHLKTLETYLEREDDYVKFTKIDDNDKHYNFLSTEIRGSEYHTDVAYLWMDDAITSLIETVEYSNAGEIDSIIDIEEVYEQLPEYVYTSEHTEFLAKNSWALDDFIQEMGVGESGNLMACYEYHQHKATRNFIDSIVEDYILGELNE